MPPCFAMGEAVGIAAALSVKNNINADEVNVKDVQSEIIKNNGYL